MGNASDEYVPDIAALSLASKAVHADARIDGHPAIAPGLHTSTTFRYPNDPERLKPIAEVDTTKPLDFHIYSRHTSPNMARFEAILTSILGQQAITYGSGLAAFHAMITHINPKRVAIGDGYHGCHGILKIFERLNGLKSLPLDCDLSELGPGDIIHVETPLNPTGEARDLKYYADRAHSVGAYLTVDATFAPPPLLDPFAWGADIVMHSGTKYIGGHSDMLCGVLAVNPKHETWVSDLLADRLLLGSVIGSLEGWLGMRSLRTLELRVNRQSATATALVSWLAEQAKDDKTAAGKTIERIQHASLQPEAAQEGSWLRQQMPNGYGPVFAVTLKNKELAKRLPGKLGLFQHATSLGGVESLVEWRAMTDRTVDQRLLRVSVGVESLEDLKADLQQGLEALLKEGNRESLNYPKNPFPFPPLRRSLFDRREKKRHPFSFNCSQIFNYPSNLSRPMPRLNLFRLPTTLRRRVRRNRLTTQMLLLALLVLLALPLYSVYCVYKPPRFLIGYLRNKFPDVLFEEPATTEKIIALSLDDAPSAHTDEIMQVLRENDAHATFFVIGQQVEGREAILRKLVAQGHELGNHAMRDEPSSSLSNDELERQVKEVKAMLTTAYEAEGKILPNNYFRPGSGWFNHRMRDLLGNRGFRIVLGSIYPHDPQIPYPSTNAKHILSMAHPGGIIICHDRRGWTAPMLRIVLPELKRQGYRIVTITDLVTSVEPLGGRSW
ncbi:cystathionine beta-lyase [Trichoderma sp. SZMC 28011]